MGGFVGSYGKPDGLSPPFSILANLPRRLTNVKEIIGLFWKIRSQKAKNAKKGEKVNSILDTRYSTRIKHPKSRIEK
ncbi:hypothetical protein ES703_67170 [subsurface metagenome]